MKFQDAEGGERQWDLISDIEKAHLFSLFVAKTSALNILVRQSRQSSVVWATCPDGLSHIVYKLFS